MLSWKAEKRKPEIIMDESFEPVVEINKDKFTDQERELILQVVARDEDILRQEKSRIEWGYIIFFLISW